MNENTSSTKSVLADNIEVYTSEKTYNIVSLILFSALLLPFGMLFSFLYSYFIWYIPFPYFNFIGTIVAGFIVGFIFPTKTSKCTNSSVALLSVIAFALICHYVGWAVWMDLFLNQDEIIEIENARSPISAILPSSSNLDQIILLFTDPSLLFALITSLAEEGYFSMFSVTPSGVGLYLIWAIELILFVGAAAFAAFEKSNHPFNIERNAWLQSTTLRLNYIEDTALLYSALRTRNRDYFEELAVTSKEESHSEIEVWHLDTKQAYISIKNKLMKINDKGKSEFEDQELIKYATINQDTLRNLLAKST
jgi:hypothetical protein